MTATPSALAASLLQQAVALHQQGKLQMAQALYRQVLELEPAQFDALHLSGVIARQNGDAAAAIELISQALRVAPDQANAHCNLGAALQDAGQPQAALDSYDRALQLNPGYALACCNRANALRLLDRRDEALAGYDRALELRPGYPEALCNRSITLFDLDRGAEALASAEQALAARENYAEAWHAHGNALQALQRFEDAVESYDRALHIRPQWAEAYCAQGTALQHLRHFAAALDNYERAVALKPHYPLAHTYRANALRALMRNDQAIAAYQLALEQGGDREQIEFALAALQASEAPPTSPAEYVKSLFDQYAEHFDRHLTEKLNYQTPAFLDSLIRQSVTATELDTLDLGCGTGLCAPYLRGYSRTLAGVDLSDKMLDKARERGLYDNLACADLADFLDGRQAAWDLAVAADVFVYIGDLARVFARTRTALRAGGHFCFSVEAGEDDDFTLKSSSRYTHSLPYLRRLAAEHGFEVLAEQAFTAREENDSPVTAYGLLLRCGELSTRC